jgi:hypothetical protein
MKIKYTPIIDVEEQMQIEEFVNGLIEKSNDGRYYFELEFENGEVETIYFNVKRYAPDAYDIVWICPKCKAHVSSYIRERNLKRDDILHLSHKIIEHRRKYCLADRFGNMEKIRTQFFTHLNDSGVAEPTAVAIFYLANALMTLLDKGE